MQIQSNPQLKTIEPTIHTTFENFLKFPSAGYRLHQGGSGIAGIDMFVFVSLVNLGTISSPVMKFFDSDANAYPTPHAQGISVRCIQEVYTLAFSPLHQSSGVIPQ